jgi:tetratricopeptide (TPR) repeat protein
MFNRVRKSKQPGLAAVHRQRRARIEQALGLGDVAGAAALAEAALAAGQAEPMILNLAAWRREEAGDFAGAHKLLRKALEHAPGDPLILGAIGAVLRKEGFPHEALATIDKALAILPGHAAGWLERGYVLDDLRLDKQATESYARAVALDPHLAPALGKLADGAAKRGEKEQGRALAARALALNAVEPAATAALATIEIEGGAAVQAEARLRALLTHSLKDDDRTRALTLLGDALDRQDRTAEAWACYQDAQAIFRRVYAPYVAPGPDRPSHRAFIERIIEQVEAAGPMLPTTADPVEGAAASHVFLLGYPRSGTTLVENILASAPDVVALEERDTMREIDHALIPNDGFMPDLDALDPALADTLRQQYWDRVRALAGEDVAGRVFVDMNPFNGVKLPVIARLFPSARILVMRRDPRDVILSCFRVNFVPSPGTYALSDLEEAARHYDALMRLTELCRGRLPLAFHEVRYDRLVSDFEPTVRALAAFIGIDWTDAFLTFDKTAKNRGVRTASATQVRRGLYDGRGQWRRYAEQLAPALPILAPWVERFGFEG